MDIHGYCVKEFEPVYQAFAELFDDPRERGAAVCIQVAGQTLVDLWAGTRDSQRSLPWDRDTLVSLYSCGKPFAAVAVLQLVERGLLHLDQPIARYWPEFAASGKQQVTLRQVLCHVSGLPALREVLPAATLYDWDFMIECIAAHPLWWAPGSTLGYAPMIYGWVLGETIRRVDGREPGNYIAEEICTPLGLDFHVGVADQDFQRIAYLSRGEGWVGDAAAQDLWWVMGNEPRNVATLAFSNPSVSPSQTFQPRWWRLQNPGLSGHGNAHGLAGFYSALLGDELLGAPLREEFTRPHSGGWDQSLRTPTRFGLGCMLDQPDQANATFGLGPRAFGHLGLGGSVGFADPQRDLAFGFVTNTMGGFSLMDPRAQRLSRLAGQSLAAC
ncbi:serine hydrolase [Pseudomonas sp. Fl5BN2]|uniref:serine hydrolase domain-containing protein n=1 Tax=unclassified Pseudomonas TaxID=196821 RepID=UPI001378A8B8|nr:MULTISPECIES: serine hydrolase domain-containing protein [unclassified Pseudomonas]NBF06348.1 serine hydrolase [Pseudomonas sp. Fl5BN2]NBF12203.1 serine hydrolase [Pseudomonas sp. Fl4BN1]